MSRNLGVGVIGCGNISTAYFRLSRLFRGIEMRACADIDAATANAKAAEFSIRAESVANMLAADDIDIVVNLTVPSAHYEVSRAILEAGKHVYSEKPFVLDVEEGRALNALAAKKGLRIGSAPDTFLGGAHQLGRHIVDSDAIGRVTSGTAYVMSHGMEHWHPNPDFFFQPGGGPVLDVGPYYIANLVQLIGPVRRVAALASIPASERTITSQPRFGQKITVATPTTIHALLEFENGAIITLNASWDVWSHGHAPMELYGEKGSLFLPDPNFFGGEVRLTRRDEPAPLPPEWSHPFAIANQDSGGRMLANYRAVGLADMALAIQAGRPHRCSGELALHVVDVMTGILRSGESGRFEPMSTTCERPAALSPAEAIDLAQPVPGSKVA
jgi:predicted dehydrogenase